MLSKDNLLLYLEEINERLISKNVFGEIVLAGGAALTLVYNARSSTKDIDAIFHPSQEFREIIKEMSKKYNLEEDWLNDGVKGFLNESLGTDIFKEYSNLKVYSINAEGLLALKLTSARRGSKDMEDSITLMRYLNIKNREQLFDIIEKYIHKNQQTINAHYFTLEAWQKYQTDNQNLLQEAIVTQSKSDEPIIDQAIEKNRMPVDDKKQQLFTIIKDTINNFVSDPKKVAEYLAFSSTFYNYSHNNCMLIRAQNQHVSFVQSFNAWKSEQNCSVKRGEHGLKILVPVETTFIKTGEGLTTLREASKEIKESFKRGELEGFKKLSFKIGTVFDISQTTFPKERYPELLSMGYNSEQHKQILEGLKDFSSKKLACPIYEADLKSITLRGNYHPGTHEIKLNQLLNDTEKLSTLSHELGHAIIHNSLENRKGKSISQIEFEADAISVMIQSHFGFELTDTRKNHLAKNYNAMLDEFRSTSQNPSENEVMKRANNVFQSVFNTYKGNFDAMQQCISNRLSPTENTLKQNFKTPKLSQP